jgi:hypothetical protein
LVETYEPSSPTCPPDDHFDTDLADALRYVTNEQIDPWADV